MADSSRIFINQPGPFFLYFCFSDPHRGNGFAFPGAKTTLYKAGMQLPCIVKMSGQKSRKDAEAMVSWSDLTPTLLNAAQILTTDSIFHGQSFLPILNGQSWERDAIYASHTFHEVTMYYPRRVIREGKYKLIMNIAYGFEYPFASDLHVSKTWQSLIEGGFTKLGNKPVDEFLHRPFFELYDLAKDQSLIVHFSRRPGSKVLYSVFLV